MEWPAESIRGRAGFQPEQKPCNRRAKKEKASPFGEAFFNPCPGVMQAEDLTEEIVPHFRSCFITKLYV